MLGKTLHIFVVPSFHDLNFNWFFSFLHSFNFLQLFLRFSLLESVYFNFLLFDLFLLDLKILLIEVSGMGFFDVLRESDFVFSILGAVIDVSIPDTIMLVPLHLAGNERCHRDVFFSFGPGSFLHVKKIRGIPSMDVVNR